MSKYHYSSSSTNQQAFIVEIYMKLIPYIIRRLAPIYIRKRNLNFSDPWSKDYKQRAYISSSKIYYAVSLKEAKAKSAIKNKLTKLDIDGRHELVVSFICNKMIPYIHENSNTVFSWNKNKNTIVRMFENDLIDQYRHANTNQSRFESSFQMLDTDGWERLNNTTITEKSMNTINFDELHECYEAFRATLRPADRIVFSCAMIPEKDLHRNAFINQCCQQLGVCRTSFYNRLSYLKDQATAYRRARIKGDM